MDKICQTVAQFLKDYNLDNPNFVYLAAFSGGYDSLCLLNCLHKISKNKIIAIHLNHKWRGEESDEEEDNCRNFCKKNNIEFYSESLDSSVPHTETAAREARYDFFEHCAKKFNSRIVFTAHNKNDNAETLLYRISMGTGVAGLQGISRHRGIFYRPLLDISRAEIEKYCQNNNLTPNIDSSNSDTKYKRNRIRTEIIPQLLKINLNLYDAFASLSEVAQEETSIIEEYLSKIETEILEKNKIKTKKFLNLSPAIQKRLIYKIFLKNNLDYDRKKIIKLWDFIRKNYNLKSGKTVSLSENLWLYVSVNYIEIITKNTQNNMQILIEKEGKYEFGETIFEIEKYNKTIEKFPSDADNMAYISAVEFPFELRTRRDGDIIKPLGANGTQKLKKYFNEKKIPNHEKDKILLLAKQNEILWVPGFGISDKIKVTDKPTHRLKIYKQED